MGLYVKSIAFFVIALIALILCFIFKKYIKYIIVFLLFFTLFYSHTAITENAYKKRYEEYGESNVLIRGIVVSSPDKKEYKNVYEIKVIAIKNLQNENIKNNANFKILCNIKKQNNTLEYGDEIEFITTYEVPSISRNDNGFNYMQYLKTKGISGIVNVNDSDINLIKKKQGNFILRYIHNFKNNLTQKIAKILPKDSAGICIGLLLGDKTLISEDIQNNFKQSSLSHMLAISGAHVSYILLGLTYILNILKLHKRWSKVLLIIFLIFFMALVDFTPSVTRACIMSIMALFSGVLFTKSNAWQNLGISNLIILFNNPYSLLDIGFELSFGGTIGIILFINNRKNKQSQSLISKVKNYIKNIILVSISANLIIFPIMLYHFNTISLTFVISNILASPLLSIALIIGIIFIIFIIIFNPIAVIISYFLNLILQTLIKIISVTSKIPFSQMLLSTPSIFQIMLYYSILIILKTKITKKNLKTIIIITQILVLITPYFIKFPSSKLKIYFIDVGQGDSTLIQTMSNKTILIDGGGSEVGSFDVGEKTLLPFLLDKGIMKIDYILFSHFDSDHCDGLFTILQRLKVKNIIISKQGEMSNNFKTLLEIIKFKKINIIIVKAGDKVQIDKDCYIDILFPTNEMILENTLNNNSIVAKFEFKNCSMLFTGDIEKIAENKIVELYKNSSNLKSTILKVAHHGSKTSSTEEFLKQVSPKICLIGVGENNKFGHPNGQTLENLKSMRKHNL